MTTTPLVPGRLPVGIDDHAYQIDPTNFRRETVPVIRQQADTSAEPGEASLNPQGLWRRSQESWHHGAGQPFLDGRQGDEATDPHRFRSSKGLDVWTKGQVSLLHPALKIWSSTATNLRLAATISISPIPNLYIADGNQLYFATMPYGLVNSLALQIGTGWTATNATISTAPSGTFFRLTATANGSMSVTSPTGTGGFPVDGGRAYGVLIQSQLISGGVGRTPTIAVTWYTAAGATISTTGTIAVVGNDNPLAVGNGSVTAPSTAAFASVTVNYPTITAAEVHEVRPANLAPFDDVSTLGYPDAWQAADIQAGEAAQAIQSIATDGSYVWAALGTSGLHRNRSGDTTSTANVPNSPGAGQISLVGYANGFLLAAGSATSTTGQNTLWVVNDPLGTPSLTVLKTHPNPSFAWTLISPGRSCVYAAGNSGGNGEVYKVTFDPNTGSLSSAVSFATYLPDGETVHALQFYAGGIVMGTGRGVRLGQADGSGNIDYGPLIPTIWPVRCLEPQDRYCWFGWTKYDATNSGLGRVDLGFFTDTLTPAYASDLMTPDTSQGDVNDVVTFAPYGYTASQRPPVRVFAVSGKGVYIEDPGSRMTTGQIQTGTIRFSTSEPKLTRSVDVRHHALPAGASAVVEMQRDTSGTWESLGSSASTGSYGPTSPLDALSETAEGLEFRFTLNRPTSAGTDFTRSVEMTRWTAKVLPTPSTIDETFTIPIVMAREVEDSNGAAYHYPTGVDGEIAYLKGLERSRTLITLQVGPEQITGYVVASQFAGKDWGPVRAYPEGVYVLQIQSVRG